MRHTLFLVGCLLFAGCSSFRAAVRDMNNADLVGEPAPPLVEGTWIGEEVQLAGQWTLVAFLLPW